MFHCTALFKWTPRKQIQTLAFTKNIVRTTNYANNKWTYLYTVQFMSKSFYCTYFKLQPIGCCVNKYTLSCLTYHRKKIQSTTEFSLKERVDPCWNFVLIWKAKWKGGTRDDSALKTRKTVSMGTQREDHPAYEVRV